KVRLALIEDRTGQGAEGLFAGIDTTLAAMPLGERRGAGSAELIRSSASPGQLARYPVLIDSLTAARGNQARQTSLLARAARTLEGSIGAPPQASTSQRGGFSSRGIEV